MLVPLPEMRTATFARSGKMYRLPVFTRGPDFHLALNGAALVARLDRPDHEDRLADCFQFALKRGGIVRGDGENHADAAIEGSRHLGRLDVALRLEESHQARLRPCTGVDAGVERSEEHTSELQSLMRNP